jgi:hypothetical protein
MKQIWSEIEVPSQPHFDESGAAYFRSRIAACKCYLEYGSGGSTVAVAQQGIPFTSVESDRQFLAAVETRVRQAAPSADGRYIAVNIGMVREWGYPVFTSLTSRRKAKWKAYPVAPWPMDPLPDIILVDGRFRIACALASIKQMYGKIEFEILFDDYKERPYYQVMEHFARLHAIHGRMAVFKQKSISLAELETTLEKFSTDYR